MPRRSSDSIIFDSLDLEGALFIPAVLEKAARGELPDQRTPADYRIPAGSSLLDEQGRAFRIASALFHTFDGNRSRSDVEASRVTDGFIKDLFRALPGSGSPRRAAIRNAPAFPVGQSTAPREAGHPSRARSATEETGQSPAVAERRLKPAGRTRVRKAAIQWWARRLDESLGGEPRPPTPLMPQGRETQCQ